MNEAAAHANEPVGSGLSGYVVVASVLLVGLTLFGVGEAALRTRWDTGFRLSDVVRALNGAVVMTLAYVAVAMAVTPLAWVRGVFASILAVGFLAAPLGIAFWLVATEPTLAFDALLPAFAAVGASGYLFWKSRQFQRLSPGVPGGIVASGLAAAALLPAQYGADRWELNGLPIAMLVVGLVPGAVAVGAFVATDLRERSAMLRRIAVSVVCASLVGLCAGLPHVFPGVIFYLKLIAVSLAAGGTIALVVPCIAPSRSAAVAASASFVVVAIASIGWSAAQSVADRFGALGFDSVAGIGAAVVSMPDDGDGDGYYAGGVPIPDCDDEDEQIFPGSPSGGCMRVELAVSPAGDDTWSEQPDHVIVVFSDALRARDVYDPDIMPWVARPGDGRVAFSRAYAPGNTTRLSVKPMWTGVTPVRFVMQLDESLRDDAWWFGNLPDTFAPRWIVASEFAWMHRPDQWTKTEADAFIGELDEKGRNIDLGIDAVLAHIDQHPDSRVAVGLFSTDPHGDYLCDDGTVGTVRCYRDELRALDRAMARLMRELEARDLRDTTLVVLTSDHGEELGEHGHFGQHASTLFDEQIHVPFVFWYPPLPETIVDHPVSGLSLVPTLADTLGVKLAFPRAEGSLLPVMLGRVSGTPAPLVHHWTGLVLGVGVRRTAVVDGELKLEYDWRTGHVRLADLAADPGETTNIAAQRPEEVARLLALLHRRQTEAAQWSGFAFEPTP